MTYKFLVESAKGAHRPLVNTEVFRSIHNTSVFMNTSVLIVGSACSLRSQSEEASSAAGSEFVISQQNKKVPLHSKLYERVHRSYKLRKSCKILQLESL